MSSGATMPARAPASIDMLQMVMRPSIERARIAEPRYSTMWPTPPFVPMRAMIPRITSFAATPAGSSPSTVTDMVSGLVCGQGLRGQDMLDLRRPDADRERAERAVRGRVRVAAHDHQPGLRVALLGADHVDDALARRPHREERDAELRGVRGQRIHLPLRDRVGDGADRRRDVVIHGRDGEVRAADGAAVQPQAVERLRAGDLVHQVQVHVEEVGLAVGSMDDVAFPDLLRERLRHRWLLLVSGVLRLSQILGRDTNMRDVSIARPPRATPDAGSGVGVLDRVVAILDAVEAGNARSLADVAQRHRLHAVHDPPVAPGDGGARPPRLQRVSRLPPRSAVPPPGQPRLARAPAQRPCASGARAPQRDDR